MIRATRAGTGGAKRRAFGAAIGAAAALLALPAPRACAQAAAAVPSAATGQPAPPATTPNADEGRFGIVLESVPVSELSGIHAIPNRLQDYNIFGSQVSRDGVDRYELVLGYFETEADADQVLATVLRDFPQARVFSLAALAPRAREELARGQAVSAAAATPATPDEEDPGGVESIVVAHHRSYSEQFGAALGSIEPELQLSAADIRSYGVSTVSELVEELAPEARSERGRGGEEPVLLLNGWRTSSLNEVLSLPTEAILRVDILPEDVALKYGFNADQRVINIVLRRKFRAVAAELAGGGPTAGGEVAGKAEADLLHIRRDDRLNLDLKYRGASSLSEAARGIVQLDPAKSGDDRSLLPATQALAANAVLARPLGDGLGITGNATLTADTSDALRGRPGAGTPSLSAELLHRHVNDWAAHLGSALNREMDEWRISVTDTYDHADGQTDTDRVDSGGGVAGAIPFIYQDHARSITDAAGVRMVANGPLLKLPAGPLFASVTAGDSAGRLSASSGLLTGIASGVVERNDASGRIDLDIPLASRRKSVLPDLGELGFNANGAVDQVTRFGTLATWGYGLNWTAWPGYVLGASRTRDQAAPTLQQLGAPALYTPGSRLFDYVTGQTLDVTQVNGGSPGLLADTRNVMKIGLTMKPLEGRDLGIVASYVRVRSEHPVLSLAAATPAVQAAFPQRYRRDTAGMITGADLRPVNIAGAERSVLRWGLNYSQRIGPDPAQAVQEPAGAALQRMADKAAGGTEPAAAEPGATEPARAIKPPAASTRRHRFRTQANEGRLQYAVYHTLYLTDRQQLTAGGPLQDLLGGGAAGGLGGQYRNEVEAKLGISYQGFGARLAADWRQGTWVQGGGMSPAGDLRFSGITTLNLRLFANLGQQKDLVAGEPWLKGVRVALYVNNLLDRRVEVRDAAGATPLAFQPGYVDPGGRTVLLTLRKLFY